MQILQRRNYATTGLGMHNKNIGGASGFSGTSN